MGWGSSNTKVKAFEPTEKPLPPRSIPREETSEVKTMWKEILGMKNTNFNQKFEMELDIAKDEDKQFIGKLNSITKTFPSLYKN